MKSKQVSEFEETEYMTIPLGDLVNNFDSKRVPISKMERKKGKIPYYGASGIVDYVEHHILEGEYLLISEDGENLRSRNSPIAFLTQGKFWPNNHVHVLQSNEKSTNYFLLYALNFLDVDGFLTGSAQPKLNQENLNLIPTPNFSFSKQKKIGEILHALDSKIENLQNQNKILEYIAQAIFKSWFVDFDGVTEWDDSELGRIPKGWRIKQINDFCKVRRGASPRPVGDPRYFGGDIPWIKIADVTGLRSPYLFSTKETVTDEGAKKSVHLPDNSLIVSNSGTVGKPIFLSRDGCIHDGWLYFENLEGISQEFLYFLLLKLTVLLNQLGDGTVQKNLNTSIMGEQQFICPTKPYLDSFLIFSQTFLKTMKKNQIKIDTLIIIRDALLPKLMSGEIRV